MPRPVRFPLPQKHATTAVAAAFGLVLASFAACSTDRAAPPSASAQQALGELPLCSASASTSAAPTSPNDALPAGRVLRRIHLALRGKPPGDDAYEALEAADAAGKTALLAKAVEESLASSDFYETMVDFGHEWLRNGRYSTGAQGDGYWGNMSAHLGRCGDKTKHVGAYYLVREDPKGANPCDDLDRDDKPTAPRVAVIEPWWAPGTTVTLVGDAISTNPAGVDDKGQPVDCGKGTEGYYNVANPPGCGCGPAAMWCYPGTGLGLGGTTEGFQRRDMWDEPARLVAHLAWHDRPLSDLVLGNYTVANNRVRAWYLRFGRQTGLYNAKLDADLTWFKPNDGAPRDPLHPALDDAEAWRELVTERLAPQLLSLAGTTASGDLARTFAWDPRKDAGPAPGLPMAGVLTMAGTSSSFPRERPRAARFLEIFACRSFTPPPPEQHFSAVGDDLAKTGPCQQCHALMDPVAATFKRWNFFGYYVPLPRLVGLGDLPVPKDLYDPKLAYTYSDWFRAGADRWRQNWKPGTTLTPATKAQIDADPAALFVDTLSPETPLFGQASDGTMGPLGFGKVLVKSGELDRCAAQRLYERFVGRRLDPVKEPGFIRALGERFVTEGRQVKPFLRYLLTTSDFSRGF
jgi:hypothetical protein